MSYTARLACSAIFILSTVAVSWPITPSAQAQSNTLSGFSLLRLDSSARTAALGSAQVALWDEDVNSFLANPALLNERTHQTLSVSYLNHLGDTQAGFIAYGHGLNGIGHFGSALRFISFGSMDRYDEDGFQQGTFSAGDLVLTSGYARSITENFHVGTNIHLGHSRLDDTNATVLMLDLGAAYQIPAHQLVLSGVINHVGTALDRYYEADLPLPMDVRLGVAKRLNHLPVTLLVDLYELHQIGEYASGQSGINTALNHVAFGTELNVTSALHIRGGYSHRHQEELRQAERFDLAGFSAGFGLTIEPVDFDYAYRSWSNEIGGLHQFTLRTRF